jgi:hypothetical protein
MGWTKPKGYSKSKVDWAGDILTNERSTNEEKNEALKVLDNWRAIHRYPMHIFKKRLKRVSQSLDKEALSVQRLKRLPSILNKLQRKYYGNKATMKLSQMQDIAGCRAVMSNVELAKKLYKEAYIRGDLKHKRVNEKDYIKNPKYDGYRSIHLIYRYKSDKGKKEFNDLLVEVQIRSKLQHLWATAVETVDFITRQSIKSNEGEKDWAEFFRLVSSSFAKLERCPEIENTPKDEKELYSLIKKMEKELNVITLLSRWTSAINELEQKKRKKSKEHFYLLELDIIGRKLSISTYAESEKDKAIMDYSRAEKKYGGDKEYDVVLVGADTLHDLRKAYPNYFVDTKEFLSYIREIINKY